MKLHVANCTHQTHFFNYKLPERTQPHGVMIKPGKQELIENTPEAIKYIIDQHAGYGFMDVKDIGPNFSGICYSIDKPVTTSQIMDGHEQNQENLENVSQEILENTAGAFAKNLENTMRQAGSEDPVGDVEMKITGEAINKDQKNAPKLDKKIVATQDPSKAQKPAAGGRGGKKTKK